MTQWRLSFSELWSWPNKQFHVVSLWYKSDSQTSVGIVIDLHTSSASRANTQKEINKNPISKTKLWSREKRLCSGLCVERARRGRVMESAQVVAGIKVLLLAGIPLLEIWSYWIPARHNSIRRASPQIEAQRICKRNRNLERDMAELHMRSKTHSRMLPMQVGFSGYGTLHRSLFQLNYTVKENLEVYKQTLSQYIAHAYTFKGQTNKVSKKIENH